MRAFGLSWLFSFALISSAFAWGPEGHFIIAEIAQRRLSPEAASAVEQLLGRGHSVGCWAGDVRDDRPSTYNWHFVDIPVARNTYDPAVDCKQDPKDNCSIAELEHLKTELRCGSPDKKIEALKFGVHFVGDAHQPLHTVLEERGAMACMSTFSYTGNLYRYLPAFPQPFELSCSLGHRTRHENRIGLGRLWGSP